jgi:uncharacterized protein YcnI
MTRTENRSTRSVLATALATALVAAAPAAAGAHVTVAPASAPAGSHSVLDVRVPNERDDAATVKLAVQLPPGFASASYEPQPGWRVDVVRERLARPIATDDGPVTEQVARIVWTGDGSPAGSIPPGAFRDFPISVKVPDEPGSALTFKALQTYSGGEVVRWIGGPDADKPAPQLAVAAAEPEHGAHADASAPAGDEQDGGDDNDGNGLAIAALAVGAAGLLLGAGALLVVRSRP